MSATQTPDTRDLAQERQQQPLAVVRDVYAGTLRMREKGSLYLPKMEREEERDYRARLAVAVLYNALRRTVRGLVGMVMRKDPVLQEDVPDAIRKHAENIDQAGRHLAVFARDHFEDAMLDGHACIFVDMHAVPPGLARNLTEERELVGRPYWVGIRKGQVLRVRTLIVGGQLVMTRFAYMETVTEEHGEFGEREVVRVRDYRLVAVADGNSKPHKPRVACIIHTKSADDKGKEVWTRSEPLVMSISRIPVATTYTYRTGYMESEPPLLDLALENVDHYQTRNDRKNVLRIASVPLLTISGVDSSSDVEVGPNSALFLPKEATASYTEPEGASLQESREELREIERRMAILGLSMLMSETRSAETATSKRIDKSESDSQLAAAARALQDALEGALQLHAEWIGEGKGGGSVEVNREFERLDLNPQMVTALSDLVAQGKLRIETLWDILQRGNVLPDDFDAELEAELLGGGGLNAPPLSEGGGAPEGGEGGGVHQGGTAGQPMHLSIDLAGKGGGRRTVKVKRTADGLVGTIDEE